MALKTVENIAKLLGTTATMGHTAIVIPGLVSTGLEERRLNSPALPIERPLCPCHVETATVAR